MEGLNAETWNLCPGMDLSSSAILNERAFCTDREDEERGCPMGEGITVVGLGTEDPRQMTVEAWEILTEAPRVFMRTKNHPAAKALLERGVPCEFFDGLDEEAIGRTAHPGGEGCLCGPWGS
ncbi:MAG: SAM-dependent methyltransferase [Limnochordia bacterium]